MPEEAAVLDERISEIVSGLARLRSSGRGDRVFGAEAHGFISNTPLTEEVLADRERRYRVSLPREYRAFLVLVGNGGAGPGYGLFRFGEVDDGSELSTWEASRLVGELASPFPHQSAWNDLSGEPAYDPELARDKSWLEKYDRELSSWEATEYWAPSVVSGAIPICHHGCALRDWLVVSGGQAGFVWKDLRAERRGLLPVLSNQSSQVGFLDWYVSWMSSALEKVEPSS